jgi:hypothetical protein
MCPACKHRLMSVTEARPFPEFATNSKASLRFDVAVRQLGGSLSHDLTSFDTM